MDTRNSAPAFTSDRTSRTRRTAALPFLFLLGILTAGNSQAQKYTVTLLLTAPGGISTSAGSMNNAGVVVGSVDDSNGNSHAAEWNNSGPAIIHNDTFPGSSSGAVAINNQSVVVGDTYDVEQGVFEVGPDVNAAQSFDHGIGVGAINDANVIVGDLEGHPAIWIGVDLSQNPSSLPTTDNNFGVPSQPGGINTAGVIVGTEYDYLPDFSSTYPVAVRWDPDPTTHGPGATVTALGSLGGMTSGANAVNRKNLIVGWATLGNNLQHAVLWRPAAGPLDLGTLGGKQSSANAINAEGDIAGQAQTPAGAWHAVLWTHDRFTRPLRWTRRYFTAIDLNLEICRHTAEQFTLTSASATNDRCMVLANGVDNKTGAQRSFVLSLLDQSQCDEDDRRDRRERGDRW